MATGEDRELTLVAFRGSIRSLADFLIAYLGGGCCYEPVEEVLNTNLLTGSGTREDLLRTLRHNRKAPPDHVERKFEVLFEEMKRDLKSRGIGDDALEEERQRIKRLAADQILNADLGALLAMRA